MHIKWQQAIRPSSHYSYIYMYMCSTKALTVFLLLYSIHTDLVDSNTDAFPPYRILPYAMMPIIVLIASVVLTTRYTIFPPR